MVDEKPVPGLSGLQWVYRTDNVQLEVCGCPLQRVKAGEAMNEVAEREN
jgi:hypothetical protein